MAKFKVGDRVLYSKSTVKPVFFEAVITEVDKTWYRVEYTDNNGNVQNEKCTEDEISLVATPKFSLMTTVTVIDNDSPYYGMSGTVKNIDIYQNVIYYDIILDYVYFKNGCTLARRQYFTDDQLKNWEDKDQAILGSKTCEAKYDNIDNGSSKFKVGDRVKIAHLYEASSEEWKSLADRTGKITLVLDSFKPPMYRVVLDGEPFMSTAEGFKMIHDYLNFNENELELAEEETPVAPKFKVGDVVTVLYESYEGQEGIVSRVMNEDDNADNTRYIVNIRSEDKVLMVVFGEEDIELSPNQDKFGSDLYIGYHKPRFKKGDLVVVTESYRIASCWNRIATVTNVIVSSTLKEMKNTYLLLFAEERFNSSEVFDETDLMKVPREPRFKLGDKVDVMFLPKIKGARTITGIEYEYRYDRFKYHIEDIVDGKVQKYFCSEAKLTSADPEELKPEFNIGDLVRVVPNTRNKYYDTFKNVVGKITEIAYGLSSTESINTYKVYFDNEDLDSFNINFQESELQRLSIKPKFAVGDKVEFEDCIGADVGEIYKIEAPYYGNYDDKDFFIYDINCCGLSFYKHENDIKLHKLTVSSEESKDSVFKPGDYVYIANSEPYPYYYANAVGMIDLVNTSGASSPSYKVYFNNEVLDHDNASPFFAESDLAFIPRHPKYKVHDLVRLLNPDVSGSISAIGYYAYADKFNYDVCVIDVENSTTYIRSEDELKPDFLVEYFHLFVSQPMSGLDMEDILKARQSAIDIFKLLYEQSCNIDPNLHLVVIDNIQEEFTKQCEQEGRTPHSLEYLGNDIKMMKDADAIIFAKGWEKSKGCSVEFLVAKNNSIPMYFE